ncbi:large subunit ribosomal protein L30 [Pilibacter termitis]|uniref:Large ribosomal subunit protein uL30 n=1 Tax=Pilibacter termitis TaxID=263852 RepID=A0A1T4PJK6_9ENTE|nr:50S ribosomal protein L30 [Pilibacter termitis]SJZ91659.1 large subunit ribosomal protein L30 [Pilibacter termitis]
MAEVKITLVKSPIGRPENQRITAKTLGLTKMHKTVVKPDNAAIRGMINTISHLVDVEEVK